MHDSPKDVTFKRRQWHSVLGFVFQSFLELKSRIQIVLIKVVYAQHLLTKE